MRELCGHSIPQTVTESHHDDVLSLSLVNVT